jgi:hypothetical protein
MMVVEEMETIGGFCESLSLTYKARASFDDTGDRNIHVG